MQSEFVIHSTPSPFQIMNRGCMVRGCRHKNTHVTSGHVCGECGEVGHGRMECQNYRLRAGLLDYKNDKIVDSTLFCKVEGCDKYDLHLTCSHLCRNCNSLGGGGCIFCRIGANEAPVIISTSCPLCKKRTLTNTSFLVYTGASCCVCFEDGPLVVLEGCNHACVCKGCAEKM